MPDKIYTRKGDDGTTQFLFAGPERVTKSDARVAAYGDVDEAVAAMGVARAQAGEEVAAMLLALQREMFCLAAELATEPSNWDRLTPGVSCVTQEMVDALERQIDDLTGRFDQPKDFIVPGNTERGASLDFACRVARRAERAVVALDAVRPEAVRYLNRLSDLLWTMARFAEQASRQPRPREG